MKTIRFLSAVWAAFLFAAVPAFAEEGHGGGVLPQLNVALYPGILFWFAVSFFAFFLIMQVAGVPGIQKTQAKRARVLSADLNAARAASEEAQKVVVAYETALSKARHQAQATVSDILIEAEKEAEAHGERLQKELSHRMKVAEDNIAAARQKAMEEAPQYVNALVQELFAKVTKSGIGAPQKARG